MAVYTIPTVTIADVVAAPCAIILPFSITMGRSSGSMFSQPDPPSLTFEWWDLIDPAPVLGSTIAVDLPIPYDRVPTWGDATAMWDDPSYAWTGIPGSLRRFTGTIAKVVAVEEHGVVWKHRITCMGTSAALAVNPVKTPRPAELDVQRLSAVMTEAGSHYLRDGVLTMGLIADADLDDNVLPIFQTIADSTGAIVHEDVFGELHYEARDARRGGVAEALPPCMWIDGIEWDQDVDQIINRVVVTYGPDTARVDWTYTDDPSIDEWGTRSVPVNTILSAATDADELAATILVRRSTPWWNAPDLTTYSDVAELPEWWLLNRLQIGDGVALPVSISPGPIPSDAAAWTIEGWTEEWPTRFRQIITLSLSDRRRWGGAVLTTWAEMRDGGTWDDWRHGSWLDVLNGID